jgi:hypothetical protein
MASFVEENVVRLDITTKRLASTQQKGLVVTLPVNESKLVNCLDCQQDLGHVEPGDIR